MLDRISIGAHKSFVRLFKKVDGLDDYGLIQELAAICVYSFLTGEYQKIQRNATITIILVT